MTDERLYSDDEVAEILDRATSTDPTPGTSLTGQGAGLTLAELEAIGSEVGIPADRIRGAAASLDRLPQEVQPDRKFAGATIGVGRTVHLPRQLTESEWNDLVVDLRETFNAKGSLRQDGAFRQWTNGNLQVLLEPTGERARLRMRTLKGSAYSGIVGGGVLTGMGAVASIFAGNPTELVIFGLIGLAGIGLFASNRLNLPRWARLRARQMEEVGARLLGRVEAAGPATNQALPPGE